MHKKMMKKRFGSKTLLLLFFTVMAGSMLLYSSQASAFALEGLNLWFTRMIPALLPFMILSGVLMGTGLSDSFAALFAPLLRPLFGLSDSCLYCIVIGFLCGFPMGARVCAQSLERRKVSAREAALLLAFCNNIGPVYFTGYVLKLFPVSDIRLVLAGMYGIPFLYGLLLRYTLYRDIPLLTPASGQHAQVRRLRACEEACPAAAEKTASHVLRPLTFQTVLTELHQSILSGLDGITVLGGYMIFCNLLNLFPWLALQTKPQLASLIGPLLEITSGLSGLSAADRSWAYILLPFGGLSCIAQTYSCIQNTELSLAEYVFHKLIQTMLTAAFYAFFPIR